MEALDLIGRYNSANPLELVEKLGIEYNFVEFPPNVKGVTYFLYPGKPIIFLNQNIKNTMWLYIVLAHEMKHALDHGDYVSGGDATLLEHEADVFAWELMTYFYRQNTNIIPLNMGGGGKIRTLSILLSPIVRKEGLLWLVQVLQNVVKFGSIR